eukprot:s1085_g15.t1
MLPVAEQQKGLTGAGRARMLPVPQSFWPEQQKGLTGAGRAARMLPVPQSFWPEQQKGKHLHRASVETALATCHPQMSAN